MPSIVVQPHEIQDARLRLDAKGVEFISYPAILDNRMNICFVGTKRPFPKEGFVRLRRGADFTDSGERIVDEFRYEEGWKDPDTGEIVPEMWLVYLQVDESAFDRLTQRLHLGLPELWLTFDISSQVITFHPATEWEDLFFSTGQRWERITEATLVQVPFPV